MKIFLIFVTEIVPHNNLNLVFMDCIRVSFIRDGEEVTWFTNYDLGVIRKVIDLLGAQPFNGDLHDFMCSLIDLLKCSDNGD